MDSAVSLSVASLVVVGLVMLAELRISTRNELRLRQGGAVEPDGDVYRTMRWAYPAAFVVMAMEGAIAGPEPGATTAIGGVLLLSAKALKYWAIASLGPRWTFRVLVVPNAPLITHGPYALFRHPNYIGVVGELIGMAVLVGAWFTGPLATLLFSLLLARRIHIENRALRHFTCS